MITDEKKEQKRVNQIRKYRLKRNLCQLCGDDATNVTHICIENYIHTDMSGTAKSDLIKKMAQESEEAEIKAEKERIEAEKIAEDKKILDEIKAEKEKRQKKKENNFEVKYNIGTDYFMIDNFLNLIQSECITHIAKTTKNTMVHLIHDKNGYYPMIRDIIRLNKLNNIFIREIINKDDPEFLYSIGYTKKLYTSDPIIIEKFQKINIVKLPAGIKIDLNIVKEQGIKL